MCFTIEPILMMNPNYQLALWDDGWTTVDETGYPAAQAEHTLLITEDGYDILTLLPNSSEGEN
jgi:methionyl aminopeptidase